MARTLAQDRYRILELLGSGTFAEVWAVLDRRLEVERAVKVLRADVDPSLGAQLSREARVLARISHPAVVHVYDVFTDTVDDAERTCVVMEKCDESLGDRVVRDGPIPEAQALAWFDALADGLAKAHALGVIHRDVKPHNILLVEGEARLADFGLALLGSSVDVVTRTSAVVGTVAFMAEAVRKGEAHTPETDRYGLAASLVYAVTGQLPGDLLRAGNRAGLSEGVRARVEAWVGAVEASMPRSERRSRITALLPLAISAVAVGWIGGWTWQGQSTGNWPPPSLEELPECRDLPSLYRTEHANGAREVLAASFADVSGDGHMDAVFTSQQDGVLHVFLGGPLATLTDGHNIEVGRSAYPPVLMDLDGDGRSELVVSVRDDAELEVIWVDADLNVQRRKRLVQDVPLDMPGTADIDGDGLLDLIGVVDNGKELVWRRNLGDGQLLQQMSLVTNIHFLALSFPHAIIDDGSGARWVDLDEQGEVRTVMDVPRGARLLTIAGVPSVIFKQTGGLGVRVKASGDRCTHPWVTQAANRMLSDHGVADWNDDGKIDLIRAQTCRGCTSDLAVSVSLD